MTGAVHSAEASHPSDPRSTTNGRQPRTNGVVRVSKTLFPHVGPRVPPNSIKTLARRCACTDRRRPVAMPGRPCPTGPVRARRNTPNPDAEHAPQTAVGPERLRADPHSAPPHSGPLPAGPAPDGSAGSGHLFRRLVPRSWGPARCRPGGSAALAHCGGSSPSLSTAGCHDEVGADSASPLSPRRPSPTAAQVLTSPHGYRHRRGAGFQRDHRGGPPGTGVDVVDREHRRGRARATPIAQADRS